MQDQKTIKKDECPHIGEMKILVSPEAKCEVCDVAEHLRLCTSCGSVFCCEEHNGHNTAHYKETGHPIITTHRTDYDFTWCYACAAYLK